MKHSVIGWNSWDVTEEGIKKVYNSLIEAGSSIDRFGIWCDWIMGVPEEWKRIGQVVPVNPHLGDHMIGSLNGVDTEHAGEIAAVLKAIGPEQLETNFGSGLRDKESMRGRVPIRPTSIVQTINHIRDEALSKIDVSDKGPLDGSDVPIDCSDRLAKMGINVDNDVDTMVDTIKKMAEGDK